VTAARLTEQMHAAGVLLNDQARARPSPVDGD
jgi:hypothetical protein